MGFLMPKTPKPPVVPPPPTPASNPIVAKGSESSNDPFTGVGSLISTSASGLRRKASTQRVSLIGG
jgi:hypothetical protein